MLKHSVFVQSTSEVKKTLLKFSNSQVISFMVSVTCCGQTEKSGPEPTADSDSGGVEG